MREEEIKFSKEDILQLQLLQERKKTAELAMLLVQRELEAFEKALESKYTEYGRYELTSSFNMSTGKVRRRILEDELSEQSEDLLVLDLTEKD